jgi:hypothetical protein
MIPADQVKTTRIFEINFDKKCVIVGVVLVNDHVLESFQEPKARKSGVTSECTSECACLCANVCASVCVCVCARQCVSVM